MKFKNYKGKWYFLSCALVYLGGPIAFMIFGFFNHSDLSIGNFVEGFFTGILFFSLLFLLDYLFLWGAPYTVEKIIKSRPLANMLVLLSTLLVNGTYFYFISSALNTSQPTGMEGLAIYGYLPIKILSYISLCGLAFFILFMRQPLKITAQEEWELKKLNTSDDGDK